MSNRPLRLCRRATLLIVGLLIAVTGPGCGPDKKEPKLIYPPDWLVGTWDGYLGLYTCDSDDAIIGGEGIDPICPDQGIRATLVEDSETRFSFKLSETVGCLRTSTTVTYERTGQTTMYVLREDRISNTCGNGAGSSCFILKGNATRIGPYPDSGCDASKAYSPLNPWRDSAYAAHIKQF